MKLEDVLKASDWPEFSAQNPQSRRCTLTIELDRQQSLGYLETLFRWICCSTDDALRLLPKDVTIAPGVVLPDVDAFLSFDTAPTRVDLPTTQHAVFVVPEERRRRARALTHHTCTIEYTQYERQS